MTRHVESALFRVDLERVEQGVRCRLLGRLDAESTEEARSALAGLSSIQVVEVSELAQVDDAGLALLAELAAAGAELEGLSPYLALRLSYIRKGSGSDTRANAMLGRNEQGNATVNPAEEEVK